MTTTSCSKLTCTMHVLILLPLIGAAFAAPDLKTRPQLASWRSESRIFGGNNTSIQTYPFTSNMQYGFSEIVWTHFCGGSLITPSTILSVAHCYYLDPPSRWRVRLGSTFASSGGSTYNVLNFHLHEDYDDRVLMNDVAIVRLTTRVPLSNTIGVARIAGPNYHLGDGTQLTAIGWGMTTNTTYNSTEILQHANVSIFNQVQCIDRYNNITNLTLVTNGSLCTFNFDGRGACEGDNGGPLVHQGDIVVGVTGWGYDCGNSFFPVVNTRVTYFSEWIFVNGAG